VAPDKFCKIEVTGSADPAFLKPGLLVKFNAQLDKKNRATAPVNELEIVTLQTAKSPEKGSGLASDDKGSKKAEKTASTEASGIVLGQVTEFKNNELSVQTSAGAIKAELAANPTIKVHVNEFRGFAQAGDKVDVQGYFVPAKPGEAIAREMKVTLTNPLGSDPTKKKPQTKSTSTTASK
jgi:hypothetical protein